MILSLETASPDISLAIARPDGSPVAVDGWRSDRRQGHEVLPRLLALLAGGGMSLADATAIAVGIGPGSFTGLRVGMSLAKGLALALDLPLVGLPSLEAWLAAEPAATAAVARAGARDAYLLIRGEAEPRLVAADALPDGLPQAAVVAPGELADAFGLQNATPPLAAAGAMATMAAKRLARGAVDELERLEPAYLRQPRGLGQVRHVDAS